MIKGKSLIWRFDFVRGSVTSFNPSQQCHLSDNLNFNWCQSVASSDVRKCHQVTSKHEIHRSSQYFPSSSFVWRHSMTSVTSIHHRWWQLTTSTSTDISQSPSSEISRDIWDKKSLFLLGVIIHVRRCQKHHTWHQWVTSESHQIWMVMGGDGADNFNSTSTDVRVSKLVTDVSFWHNWCFGTKKWLTFIFGCPHFGLAYQNQKIPSASLY